MWCAGRVGMRIHGSTQARPAELFARVEAPVLLPVPAAYDVPVFTRVKVHRDLNVEVAKALYSVPGDYLGRNLDARADRALVKLYDSGRLVRIHPRQEPGGRYTDPADIPTGKAGYALLDLDLLVATAASRGPSIGVYAAQILDGPRPWARVRAVYRLLGLVRRYGKGPVEMACTRALELDVVSVMKIESMLQRATENTIPLLPGRSGAATARFARDRAEYATSAASAGASLATDATAAATPFNEVRTGAKNGRRYFKHIVVDFPLPLAMKAGLVRSLALDKRKEIAALPLDFNAERDDRGKVIGLSNGQRTMIPELWTW